jgi:hypothetical protein
MQMPEGMTIRAAKPSDADCLLAVWLASVRATHAFLSEDDVQDLMPLVRDKALPALELWVLVEGQAIIGLVGLSGNKIEAAMIASDLAGFLAGFSFQVTGYFSLERNFSPADADHFWPVSWPVPGPCGSARETVPRGG